MSLDAGYYQCQSCGYVRVTFFRDPANYFHDSMDVMDMNVRAERQAKGTPCPKCGGAEFSRIRSDDIPEGVEPDVK